MAMKTQKNCLKTRLKTRDYSWLFVLFLLIPLTTNAGVFDTFKSVGADLWSTTKDTITNTSNTITSVGLSAVSYAGQAGNNIVDGTSNAFSNGISEITNTTQTLAKTGVSSVGGQTASLYSAVTCFISGLVGNGCDDNGTLKIATIPLEPTEQDVPASNETGHTAVTPPEETQGRSLGRSEATEKGPSLVSDNTTTSPNPVVIERIITQQSGVTQEQITAQLQALRNELIVSIAKAANSKGTTRVRGYSTPATNFQAIALSQKIDKLTNTVITNPTITGATISGATITGGSVAGSVISGAISLTDGTFSGSLTVNGTGTSTFAGDSNFDSSTLYIDSLNNRVGIGTSSPSDTLSINGPVYLANISAPSTNTNRLYSNSGSLYWAGSLVGGASVGSWALNGSDIYYNTGNVGIGTSSPYAKLSVVGEVVAANFTATSTTQVSTFTGGVNTSGTTGGYQIDGTTILQASSTNFSTLVGNGAGASLTATGLKNTAVGYQALNKTTTGFDNTATGYQALYKNTTGVQNIANGYQSLHQHHRLQ